MGLIEGAAFARNVIGDGQQAFEDSQRRRKTNSLAQIAGQYFEGGQQADPRLLGQFARDGGNAGALSDNSDQRLGQDIQAFLANPDPAMYQQFLAPRLKQRFPQVGAGADAFDPSHQDGLRNLSYTLLGQKGQAAQNQLPADARSALFFRDNPELLAQEQERYKNRPFYNPATDTLVYPKGSPAAPQAPQAPQSRPSEFVLDDAALQALMSVPPQERGLALKAMITGGDFHAGADGQPVAGLSAGASGPAVVQVGPGAAARAADVERAKTQATIDVNTNPTNVAATAGAAATTAGATEAAKSAASAQAARDDTAAKKAVGGKRTLELLDGIDTLIDESTGSALGNVADQGAAAFGKSTEGARAIAQLRTRAGQLVAMMPRMEGPQSNYDVQLYTQMAGDLANPVLPRETRKAAAAEIRRLNDKYATNQPASGGGNVDALLDKYK